MALRCLTKLKFNHQILKSSRVLGIKNSKILLNVNTDFQIDGLEKINLTQVRHRYDKSSKSKQPDLNDQDSDDENDFLEDPEKKNIVKYKVPSLRIDLIIKSGLSIARNKIELAFYENKIRKNGQKIAKKSLPVNIGDEIDFIKDVSSNNPNHLIVSRLEILEVKPKDELIEVTMKRFKSITVEKYKDY